MYKEFCSIAIQTDDLGCNNGCTSVYIDAEPCAFQTKQETFHLSSFIPVNVLNKKLERIPQHVEIGSDEGGSVHGNNKDSCDTTNTLPGQNAEYDLVNVEHRFEYSVKYAEFCDIPNAPDHNETKAVATGSAICISTALQAQQCQPTEDGSNAESCEHNNCCQGVGLTSQSHFEKEQNNKIHSKGAQSSLQQEPTVSGGENEFGNAQEPNNDTNSLKTVCRDLEKSQAITGNVCSVAQGNSEVDKNNYHDVHGSDEGHLVVQGSSSKHAVSSVVYSQSDTNSTEKNTKSQHNNTDSLQQKPSLSCSFCGKEFRGRSKLLRHLRVHTGEKPFTCLHCPKKFGQKTHLNNHLKIHNNEKSFQCSYCEKKFRDKTCFKYHLKTHTGDNLFECPQCKKRYPRQCDLTRHLKVHTGERPFECSQCGRKFTYKHDLKRHQRVHTGEKLFGCSFCDKRFARKSDLTNHERIHSGEKPFGCPHCDKNFTQRQHLRQHIRVHTGETPHECGYCAKKFSQRSGLTAHLRVHSGEKPHQCTYCERKFADKRSLKKHVEIHELHAEVKSSECSFVQKKVDS